MKILKNRKEGNKNKQTNKQGKKWRSDKKKENEIEPGRKRKEIKRSCEIWKWRLILITERKRIHYAIKKTKRKKKDG